MMSWRRTHSTSILLMVTLIIVQTTQNSCTTIILMKASGGATLTCHPAEYRVGDECCPKCPPGHRVETHCEEFRSTSCLPCAEGTFVDRINGLTNCITCTMCDSASGLTIKRPCTATSDAVCKPMGGFYCMDFKGEHCEAAAEHKSCNPGQYISQKGTDSTDTVCTDCKEETFSNRTSSFQMHTECEELNPEMIKPQAAFIVADKAGLETVDFVAICLTVFAVVVLVIVGAILFRRKPFFSRCREKCSHKNTGDII